MNMCLPKFDIYHKLKPIQTLDDLIFSKISSDFQPDIHLVRRNIVFTRQLFRAC